MDEVYESSEIRLGEKNKASASVESDNATSSSASDHSSGTYNS